MFVCRGSYRILSWGGGVGGGEDEKGVRYTGGLVFVGRNFEG